MPVRAVATGFRATATLTGASITAATAVSATLAKTGVGTGMKVAIIPLRAGAKALSGELSRETLGRNCWRGERRAWIEVRGLRSGGDDELGRVVLNAIQAHPGVGSASLNYPLSRVVVAIDDPDTSLRELCRIVDDAEKAERHRHPDQAADQLAQSPGSLPGDGVLLAVRAVTVAATAAGLGLALGGRALRWPRFPLVIEAAVAAVDHQPLLRRLLEDRIGTEATATVLELAALDATGFVVSLELRHSAVTERADVVFPVAPTTQKAGAFVNWEGRYRTFEPALRGSTLQAGQSDHRVLDALADDMGVHLGVPTVEAAREELAALGIWDGKHAAGPHIAATGPTQPEAGEAILTGWRMLLDEGRLQDGEPYLAGTARTPVVRLSPDTAAEIGAADGEAVTVSTSRGSITLPCSVTDMPDRVVWLPLNSAGSTVHRQLRVTIGSIVKIGAGS